MFTTDFAHNARRSSGSGPALGAGRLMMALAFLCLTATAQAADIKLIDSPFFKDRVEKQQLPDITQRVPKQPLVADLEARSRVPGRHGGDIRTLVSGVRDLRYITVYGYTRLVGYNEKLELKPDLLADIEVEGGRIFTLTLREGHRWSDGKPFTTEDFRYYWQDMANNKMIAPSGPPEVYYVEGELAKFEVLDERRVRFSWSQPNERLLPFWAQPGKVFAYAPAHYLKQFHAKYTPESEIKKLIAENKVRSWAALHNRKDDPYENGNIDMPVLTPWKVVTKGPASRYIFERNPYYHRIDPEGRQLPYVDRILVDLAAGGLIAAKANAGETDLQGRGLSMVDAGVLKEGEKLNGYRTLLWPYARGSAYALYPNLNTNDPEWRKLNRDLRWRRALSHAIDRRIINNALLFGLGREVGNSLDPHSPLYSEAAAKMHMSYDPAQANRLLDEIGLKQRDSLGIRLLPDGRRVELLVELNGGDSDMLDALQLIAETWAEVGVKLIAKPQDRTILRQRSYTGQTVMVMSTGLDNSVPTAAMPPIELAPAIQDNYAWPKWGQHVETKGKSGEAVDMPEAKTLLDDYSEWRTADDMAEKTAIWKRMIASYAANLWTIGTVAGELQPVVVSNRLRNVPEKAIFAWEPMALFGVHRIDEFFYAE